MEPLNAAFYFVIDKLVDLQTFFIKEAWAIGRIILFIAIVSAAVNYALTGEGLKSNIIKIGKALLFFFVIMWAYPQIIGHITVWTYTKARDSAYSSIGEYVREERSIMIENAVTANTMIGDGESGQLTFASEVIAPPHISSSGREHSGLGGSIPYGQAKPTVEQPDLYFTNIIIERDHNGFSYSVVAPAAAMEAVLLVAGACVKYADNAKIVGGILPDFAKVLKGLICAFFVIVTGTFAILEYIMAFLEFMIVSSVGIIFFPLSLWEGSKFMSEKFISAIIGFFVKLLFCSICVFLMLYGFYSLATVFSANAFEGKIDQIATVLFVSLLFFYLCKSAPGLAQSLLTGTPSLSASGAISAVAGGINAAKNIGGAAAGLGGVVAGGVAKTAFNAAGAGSQALGAWQGAKEAGGNLRARMGAVGNSLATSAGQGLKAVGSDLTRSLLGGGRGGGGGSGGGGVNSYSNRQKLLADRNADGTTNKRIKDNLRERKETGKNMGGVYSRASMAKQQAVNQKNN